MPYRLLAIRGRVISSIDFNSVLSIVRKIFIWEILMFTRFMPATLPFAAIMAMVAPGHADAIADFFKDKQINAISGGGAGGGFSFVARVLGQHMADRIPGKPGWIVTAMPGAGGARSIKYIVNAAPQDGTVIGVVLPPAVISPLLRKNVGFNSEKLQWIGSVTPMASVLVVWHTAPVKTLDDVKKIESTTATSSKLSSGYFFPSWLNATIGTRFKVISGYRGGDRQNVAMEKGEVNGRSSFYNSFKTTKPGWLRDKTIRILAYMGPKETDLAGVPHMMDLMKTGEQRAIGNFLQTGSRVGHGFFVSPGVPKARVMALRTAFNATMADPAFLADAKKRNMVVAPVRGEELDAVVSEAMKTPPSLVQKFRKMVKIDKLKPSKGKK